MRARGARAAVFAYCLLLAAGLFSIAGVLFAQFSLPYFVPVLCIASAAAAFFLFALLRLSGAKKAIALLSLLFGFVTVGVVLRDWFLYGAYIFARHATPHWMAARHYEFTERIVFTKIDETSCAVFFVFALTLYAVLLAWATVARRSALLSLAITIPVFAVTADLTGPPSGLLLFAICAFWSAMILQAGISGRMKDGGARVPLVCLAGAAAVFAAIFLLFPGESYVASPGALVLREEVKDAAMNISYSLRRFSSAPGSGPVSAAGGAIALNDAGEARFPDRVVMRVHMDDPHELYLRGYSSADYTGSEWEPGWEAFGESGIGMEPLACLTGGQGARAAVTVEPDLVDSGFLFTPYLFAGVRDAEEPPAWVGDAYLKGNGRSTYVVETYDTEGIVIDADSDFFALLRLSPGSGRMDEMGYAVYVPYIAEEYTRLPDGLRETLLDWWQSQGNREQESLSANQWAATAALVAKEVRSACLYKANPGVQPANRDFVEYFLNESREGYCVHFASATTAVLRALGVPARYVEGYVVRDGHFDGEGWADVEAKNAHAWSEVWTPGIGWIPVESTPGGLLGQGGGGTADVPATAAQGASPSPGRTVRQEESESAEPTPETRQEARASEQATPRVPRPPVFSGVAADGAGSPENGWPYVLWAGIAITLPAAFLLAYRQWNRGRRSRMFRHSDPNTAALYLCGYLERLSKYGRAVSPGASAIALKAQFSSHAISEGELRLLRAEAEEGAKSIWDGLPRRKKLLFWLKYT